MMKLVRLAVFGSCMLLWNAGVSHAAFLLEVDVDGADDGPITYNPLFSFGGDTTTASTSAASAAFGLTPGDSIFGGDGVSMPDTYVYTYNPMIHADNLAIAPGQDLGNGNAATGFAGGGAGMYNIYATWPLTANVSGGLTQYDVTTFGAPLLTALIDQNNGGGAWVLIGQILYTSGAISVTQEPTLSNSFVSMRAAALLFESAEPATVPEPGTMLLLGTGLAAVLLRRRLQR